MKRFIAILSAVTLLAVLLASLPVYADHKDSYKIGDADGNGAIEVVDATLIQRVITSLSSDDDGMIARRGDGNGDGLDVADAAAVQRYTLDIPCRYSVGERQYEDATQAPVQEPTYDEYELPIVR